MAEEKKLIPIYTTSGEIGAFLVYPNIYNRGGEWIGWVTADQNVFSVHGQWVGRMTSEPRILRNRESPEISQRIKPPAPPPPIRVPYRTPLAPQMGEIGSNLIDVLDEASEMMPTIDFGEMLEDMD